MQLNIQSHKIPNRSRDHWLPLLNFRIISNIECLNLFSYFKLKHPSYRQSCFDKNVSIISPVISVGKGILFCVLSRTFLVLYIDKHFSFIMYVAALSFCSFSDGARAWLRARKNTYHIQLGDYTLVFR